MHQTKIIIRTLRFHSHKAINCDLIYLYTFQPFIFLTDSKRIGNKICSFFYRSVFGAFQDFFGWALELFFDQPGVKGQWLKSNN